MRKLLSRSTALVAVGLVVSGAGAAYADVATPPGGGGGTIVPGPTTPIVSGFQWGSGNININGNLTVSDDGSDGDHGIQINHENYLYFFDSDNAVADTVTISGNLANSVVVGATETLEIHIGRDNNLNNTNNANITFAKNIVHGGTSGKIDIKATYASVNTITFEGAANDLGTAGAVSLDHTGDTVVFSQSAAQTFTGNIAGRNGSGGGGNVNINNTHTDATTITGNVGQANNIGTLTVGSTGNADSYAAIIGNIDAGAIVLGDGANTNNAYLVTGTSTADTTVAGTINEAAGLGNDVTRLSVLDYDNTALNKVTFSGAIGGSRAVDTLQIGDSANVGHGQFDSTVNATAITVDASSHANGSTADFNGAVIGGITITSGTRTAAMTAAAGIDGTTSVTTAGGGNVNLTYDGAGDRSIGAVDVTDTTGTETLTVANTSGTVTFTGNLGGTSTIDQFTINANAAASMGALTNKLTAITNSGTLTLTGNMNNTAGTGTWANNDGSTLALGTANATHGGGVTFGSTSTTTLTIGGNTSGRITTTGAATFTAGATVTPSIASGISVRNGEKFILIDGGAAATVGAITIGSGNGILLNYAARAGTGDDGTDRYGTAISANDVILVATVNSVTGVSGASSAISGAAENLATYSGTDTKLVDLSRALQGLGTAGEMKSAAEQLAPAETSGGNSQGAMQATSQVLGIIETRTAEVRTAHSGRAGVASGEAARGMGVWGQVFGFAGSQGAKDGINGYDAETFGAAVGMDFKVADAVRLGVAGSYANTDVSGKNSNSGNLTDIDSYQLTLYGSYEGAPWYVNGALAGSYHNFDQRRQVSFVGINDMAKADYAGWQGTAEVDGGYPISVGKAVVTPVAGVAFSRLQLDGYTETGSTGAPLRVQSRDLDSLKSTLGVKVASTFVQDSVKLTPELRASWVHEYMSDAVATTAAFAGGGSTFTTTGQKPASDALVLGVGLAVATVDSVTVSANYDLEMKDKYYGHTGLLQVRADF